MRWSGQAWMWLVLAGSDAMAACPADTTTTAFASTLDAAETAYGALDGETFATRMDDAAYALPCVSEPATPQLASRYHRLTGLRWYALGQEDQAARAFAAARAATPGFDLPTSLVPSGHAARDAWARVPVEGARRAAVGEPVAGHLLFDGVEATSRPEGWPAWLQVVTPDGAIAAGTYLLPGDALPPYEARPLPDPPGTGPTFGPAARATAGGTAIGLAVTGTVLYALAARSAAQFDKPNPSYGPQDLAAHRMRTNRLVIASATAGGLATLAGVGFVVMR